MTRAKIFLAGVLALGLAACQELEVTNPNNPDRETVLESAADVEALIATSFRTWVSRTQGTTPAIALSTAADEFTTGFFDFGAQDISREPRAAINNTTTGSNLPHPATWADYYRIIAGLNTAIQAVVDNDLQLVSNGVDVTQRGLAFAKFVQGLSHGYAALTFDKGFVASETLQTDTIQFSGGSEEAQALLRPYTEVRDTALAELGAALLIAEGNEFTLPGDGSDWISGVQLSNQALARVIHSYIARIMVYSSRDPAERAAVDWQEVISHIDQGVTENLAPVAVPSVLESIYKQRAFRTRTTIPSDFMRVDYRIIGPSDMSEAYIEWLNTPFEQRLPFQLNTADRRFVGAEGGTSAGGYGGYHRADIFNADRGTGQRSYYFFSRFGSGISWQSGPIVLVSTAEMDLLKAEGLIRLGRAAEAVPLINRSRVANGQLPPVDVGGVPGTAPDCAPRKTNGACGSLWDALRYEKLVEGLGVEGGTAFYDRRGWGDLTEGTPLHFPIPARDLELLQLALYSTGGAQGDAAPPADGERCPVALPRCP